MKKGTDYIGVAVVPFLHDGAGEYLVGLRSDKCRDEHGTWEPAGGGGVKLGETLEGAIMREVYEEVGVTPFNLEYLGVREVFREMDGQATHWIAFDFKAQVERSEVKIMEPEKCLEHRWCTVLNIPQPQHSQFPLFLERYKSIL